MHDFVGDLQGGVPYQQRPAFDAVRHAIDRGPEHAERNSDVRPEAERDDLCPLIGRAVSLDRTPQNWPSTLIPCPSDKDQPAQKRHVLTVRDPNGTPVQYLERTR